MPTYVYKAVNSIGEIKEGEVSAADQNIVVEKLREQGMTPIKIEALGKGKKNTASHSRGRKAFGKSKISQDEVFFITQQLATLLKAGLPLDKALATMAGVTENKHMKEVLENIKVELEGGSNLADALDAQGHVFTRFYINMVRAGEAGIDMAIVLARLSEFMDRAKKLRETVSSALIYPMILTVVAAISVIVLLTFVVPQFSQMFEDSGKALPVPTQIVVAAGDLLKNYWWVGTTVLILISMYFQRAYENSVSRLKWDRRWLKLPLLGDLIRKIEMAKFSRTLGTLLENGVPLLSALSILKEIIGNQALALEINKVAESVSQGENLTKPLLASGEFPRLALQMVSVGEETGQLEVMLIQVADVYDREVKTTVERMLAMLEPAIILGLGVVIAGIIMSILVAIVSVNDLVV
ncbi:MAG: type II secretion system F family protein [Methylococcales bacterium]|jgi:general secretion pathway protein F|nr:type II secretion system F family protein [Methylococcales bacterium]MBT7443870.1 type II secretion system F family protein [Methylococcales bacterium]